MHTPTTSYIDLCESRLDKLFSSVCINIHLSDRTIQLLHCGVKDTFVYIVELIISASFLMVTRTHIFIRLTRTRIFILLTRTRIFIPDILFKL